MVIFQDRLVVVGQAEGTVWIYFEEVVVARVVEVVHCAWYQHDEALFGVKILNQIEGSEKIVNRVSDVGGVNIVVVRIFVVTVYTITWSLCCRPGCCTLCDLYRGLRNHRGSNSDCIGRTVTCSWDWSGSRRCRTIRLREWTRRNAPTFYF